MRERLKTLFHFRELLMSLFMRDLTMKYRGSALGFLWALINPLITLAILSVVFTRVLRMGIPHYPLFLFCALIPWNFLQQSLQAATMSLPLYGPVVTRAAFPREVIPLSLLFSNFVHTFLVGLVINVALIILYRIPVGAALLYIPLICMVQVLFTAGIALILSCLQVYYRDVNVLLTHGLTFWFYATPILYPLSMVPEPYAAWIAWNPLTGIIMAYRNAILFAGAPPWALFSWSALAAFITFLAGYHLFNRHQDFFAEEL
ncbi:MAG: ABC transporter permease [Candidatus Eremiobacteraeota bacterium]|nr:ABC transporter permease [Candidatus Eremiobacteraeota bacterium]